jgi:formylglycine-generating enzyme required for sulfatase activity
MRNFFVIAFFLFAYAGLATGATAGNLRTFVVGINNYDHIQKLESAVRDATDVHNALVSDVGYLKDDAVLLPDPTSSQFSIAWENFLDKMDTMDANGIVLFYFAGHGVQLNSDNYLLPRDLPLPATSDQSAVRTGAIDLQVLLKQFGARQVAKPGVIGVFIIDACRDNPFDITAKQGADEAALANANKGLGPLLPPSNIFVMYSAGIGQKALDGGTTNNSVFVKELLELVRQKDQRPDFAEVAQRIRFKVYQSADRIRPKHVQTPAYYDQLLYRHNILGERSTMDAFTISSRSTGIGTEIAVLPRGLGRGDQFLECETCPEMAVIPSGVNQIAAAGAPLSLPRALAIGKHEITNAQWNACAAAKDSPCKPKTMRAGNAGMRPQDPVTDVTWQEARDYAAWLSKAVTEALKKKDPGAAPAVYRLPSEVEWEYAARAGSKTAYSFGDDTDQLCTYANGADQSIGSLLWVNHACSDGVGRSVAPVGTYKANAWNLHDMHGNVWEWTAECQPAAAGAEAKCTHSARGGSWRSAPASLRSDARQTFPAGLRRNSLGFRVVRDLPPT